MSTLSHPEQLPAVDWDLCLTVNNNKPSVAKDLLRMLKAQLPTTLQDIKIAYHKQDFPALSDHLHSLYGATCFCGTPALKNVTKSLEDIAKGPNPAQNPNLVTTFAQFNHQVERVIETINNDYPD